MRKVYLDNLPKWKNGSNKGKIDWKNSIGHRVKFVYDDIKGEVEIVDYDGRYLTLIFDNKKFNIQIGSLKSCRLENIIKGKMYKYNIGDIVNGLEVLEHIRVKHSKGTQKGYKVKCLKDGYIHEKSEYQLISGNGCPVCVNKKIVKGINDIATTNPEYVKYFVNIEDAYKYSKTSGKQALMKCPICTYEKSIPISRLTTQKFGCPKCSDGKSYPEKFMFNILDQLGVNFETEKVFDWGKDKRYDFYIPESNYIIETHGEQHYDEGFSRMGKKARTLEQEEQNDIHKQQLAIYNNIKKYIVVDCRKSEIEWIKSSILNSELNDLFDLSKVNWIKCHEFACSSRVKEACDLWNGGVGSTVEIGRVMKLGRDTVWKYLKQGTELGWCDYDAKNVSNEIRKINNRLNSKKCKVILNGKETIYSSRKECLLDVDFSWGLFDKLIKSKEPYRPFYKQHKHLEGMRIEYVDNI